MASQDTFFKVKTGLGVGTDTLYADAQSGKVAIGATEGDYALDVYGTIYSDVDILVDNSIGIGTTVPVQRLDVRGVGIFSGVGIAVTNPTQNFQVNRADDNPVVITGFGSLGINNANPTQRFHLSGEEVGESVVITGFSSIGIRVLDPEYDIHYKNADDNYDIVVNSQGFIGFNVLNPEYNVDIANDLRVSGLATITSEFVGFSTIGIASITQEVVGFSTIGIASITREVVGVSTIGIASITREVVGVSTIGIASITREVVGVSTIGIASITQEVVGFSTIGIASITEEVVGVSTIGIASITQEVVGFSTIGIASITQEVVGVSTIGIASITQEVVGFSTIGIASITQEVVGVSTIGIASITQEVVGVSTIGVASITNEVVGFSTIGVASITNEVVGFSTIGVASITNEVVGFSTIGVASITNEVVGFSTIGVASITREVVGFSTIGVASITNEVVGFSTIGIASITQEVVGVSTIGIASITREKVLDSEIENLLVTGITTTAKLDVGIGATLLRARGFGFTTVTDLEGNLIKEIRPIVGINTTIPTRTLDIEGDLRVRGEIIDSNNQVGYAYSVLASSGAINISGRFIDAANLLIRNKEFIAEEIVGFITSTDGLFGLYGPNFDYGPIGIETGRSKCKRDIGLIIDSIAFDITKGGNSKSVGAGVSYSLGNYLESSNPPPPGLDGYVGGYVKYATLAGISSIATLAQYVINNSRPPVSYQSGVSSVSQLIDTEIAPDGDSNTNINGCSNVVSAIHSAVGIVTTIIGVGFTASGITTNYPSGELVWQPPGPRIGNEWFVNKLGDDSNGGTGPGNAFLTIKKAASIAQPGDTIKVYAGLYIEDGPIQLNERVAVVGEDLRRTLVTTRDKTDLFYVKRGCYVSQMSFVGEANPGKAMVSFPTQGYGYANGTEENWQSPYVQNCTNFVPDSIGMRIDGNRAGGFKSMVLDAYTQYNQGGIGVSITNFGYAQLVSLFTICCDTAVFCDSGGVCDLNNSNSSFGNYGLVSNGATPLQYTGTVVEDPAGDNVDRLVINVGVGASQEFKDSVTILRENRDFIASEVVGFITSTNGPFGAAGTVFDYGGSVNGREFCRRDSKIIVDQICADILNLGNLNSIDAGLAYRDSADGSLTYLNETSPPPVGFSSGYVKDAEIAAIQHIAGISTYIVRNLDVPVSYQIGIGSFPQVKVSGMTTSPLIDSFIASRVGIITSIIGIGTQAVPEKILPKGQRPYDGQIAVVGTQYYFISRIEITNPGSGYDPNIPVNITISLPPQNPDLFIPAEAAIFESNINADGTISGVEILVSGTGYNETPPTVVIDPPASGIQAEGVAVMEKLFFNPILSTQVSAGGTTTVTFDEFITYSPIIGIGETVYFYQSSKIIASSITFEYIGTGINIVNAIPSKGAVPIDENQIVATNGGKVPFTSTDQSGDFRISEGITINQNTGTISGQAFSKSLQAEVTPLIIALQQ
jgi:hypothetical protein